MKIFILKAIFIICFPLVLLLSTVSFVSTDIDFYLDSFERNGTVSETGYSTGQLEHISLEVIDYLKGKRDDFNIEVEDEQVFGEREKLHMEDVQYLFKRGFLLRNISLLLSLVSSAAIFYLAKEQLGKTLIISSLVPIVVMAVLAAVIALDFNSAFNLFHHMLFDNDLWLLDPRTDLLIQMLPLDFFYRMTLKIIVLFLAELAAAGLIGYSLLMNFFDFKG